MFNTVCPVVEAAKRLLEQGPSIVSTKCRLQFNFVSLCLLHRDVQSSSTSLREYADTYFSNVSTINTSGILDEKQIYEHRLKYSQACAQDHLSYVCSICCVIERVFALSIQTDWKAIDHRLQSAICRELPMSRFGHAIRFG